MREESNVTGSADELRLNSAHILALYDAEERRNVECFDTRREASTCVVRHTSRLGGQGAVIYSDLSGADVVAVVLEQVRYFESIGQDFEWKVYEHDLPSDLGAQLVTLGFKEEAEETVVILDLGVLPDRLITSTNENVERVFDPDCVDEIMRMMQAVWNEDFSDLAASLRAQLSEDASHLGLYVVRIDAAVTSVGWIRFQDGGSFASLWGGTTLPKYRNRGLYSALVAVRAREALRRGSRYLTVDAAPTSRPILEKLGFRELTRARGYTWSVKRRKDLEREVTGSF
jgi:GNAT superfamily N-acetyltransferase